MGGRNSVLLVGVDTDEYLHRVKGDGHPFFSQKIRAQILAALSCVDWVVILDGPRKQHSDFVSLYKQLSSDWIVFGNTDISLLRKIKKQVLEAGSKFKHLYNVRKLDSSSRIIDKLRKI